MLRKCLALLALCLVVAGCTGGMFPASPSKDGIRATALLLQPPKSDELRVWGSEHRDVWDKRVHTGKTCPFFVYTPAFYAHQGGTMSDAEWAKTLHKLYKYKHREEGSCDCDEMLGIVAPPAPPAPAPDVTGTFTIEPDAPPPRADPPDDEDDDRDKLIEDLLRKYRDKYADDLPDVKVKTDGD